MAYKLAAASLLLTQTAALQSLAVRRHHAPPARPRLPAPLLQQVRNFDENATLVVVPLSTVYEDVAKTASDAAAARGRVAQPRESTSTDLRLFVLKPLSDEGAKRWRRAVEPPPPG